MSKFIIDAINTINATFGAQQFFNCLLREAAWALYISSDKSYYLMTFLGNF